MNVKTVLHSTYNFLKTPLLYYARVLAAVFVSMLLLRVAELVQMTWLKPVSNGFLPYELLGFLSDLAAFSHIAIPLLLLTLLLCWTKYTYKILLHVFAVVYVFIDLAATFYFFIALSPLDHTLYTYSMNELVATVKATNLGIEALLFIILPIAFYFAFFHWIRKAKFLIPIMFTLLAIGAFTYPHLRQMRKNTDEIIMQFALASKADFFITKSLQFYKERKDYAKPICQEEILQFIQFRNEDGFYAIASNGSLTQGNDEQIPFLSKYPLLNHNHYDPLGAYFKPLTEKPNIVFILVESLGGHAFFPPDSTFCCYPFLDSLKNHSLYWSNCFSGAGRTFGVLPNIMGSLPFGKNGFLEEYVVANHLSVPSVLKSNGYQSNFFYGGKVEFQNMASLLVKEGVDHVSTYFPPKYDFMERIGNKFTWGLPDEDVFNRSIEILDSIRKQPMLNIYLTISMHNPFFIPNKEKYHEKVKSMIKHKSQKAQNLILKNIDPWSSVLYSDECIQKLIADYKRKGWYDNTIFIITGDHCMHELGRDNLCQMFHVPLIIHSPLLKAKKQISAFVSHLDIAPSVLNLLKNNHVIESSTVVSWMGYGLDMDTTNPKKPIYLMRENRVIDSYIYGNYLLSENRLFHFTTTRKLTPVYNDSIKNKLAARLENFKKISNYTVSNHNIIPNMYLPNQRAVKQVFNSSFKDPIRLNPSEVVGIDVVKMQSEYKALFFDYTFDMPSADSDCGLRFEIDLLDANGKCFGGFELPALQGAQSHSRTDGVTSFRIRLEVPNSDRRFDSGNSLYLFVRKADKSVEIKNLKIQITAES